MEIEEIKQVRKRLGLTQTDLAQHAGVSQSLIAKIESKKLDPTYSNAKKIFKALSDLSNKNEMKAKDIAQKKIISVKPDSKIKAVIRLMRKHNISQLPVIENNTPLGIISERIILECLLHKKCSQVSEIMKDSPPVVSGSTSASAISSLLRFFPIVLISKNGKLTGVITKSDLIETLY